MIDYKTNALMRTYPWNVAVVANDLDEEDVYKVYIPKLMNEIEHLSDRERNILIKRYHDNKTLEEVGKDYGITRERIRQIEAKVMFTLHDRRNTYLFPMSPEGMSRLKIDFEELERDCCVEVDKDLKLTPEDVKTLKFFLKMQKPIEVLGLSVRSLNALKRSGITYLYHLNNVSEVTLMGFRGLGENSAREITSKFNAYLGR